MRNVKFGLQLELQGDQVVVRGLDNARGSVKEFRGEVDQSTKDTDKASQANQRHAQSLTLLKTAVVAVAAAGIGKLFFDAVREQEQLQRNMLRTEQLVRSTGAAAGFTAEQLHEQARGLAFATLQSTEGVMAAQQVMLSFRKVSGETFTRATELAADLATVTGTDLKSSVTQLGKALEDPVQGINAMTRSGVSFTQAQKDVIKSMVETGDVAGAQKLILDELANQYGGVARAEAMGLAGAQDTLAQSVQEAKIALADYFGLGEKNSGMVNALAIEVQAMTAAVFGSGEAATAAGDDFAGLHTALGTIFNLATITKEEFADLGDVIGYQMARIALEAEKAWKIRTFQWAEAEQIQAQINDLEIMRGERRVAAEERIVQAIATRESASRKLRQELEKAQEDVRLARVNAELSALINNTELFGFAQDEVTEGTKKKTEEEKEAEKAAQALAKAQDALFKALLPVAAKQKDIADQLKMLDGMYQSGKVSTDQYREAKAKLQQQLHELNNPLEQTIVNIREETAALQAELAATIAGEEALRVYNRSKTIEAELRRQNVEAGSEEEAQLRREIAARYDAAQALADYKTSTDEARRGQEEANRVMEQFVTELVGGFAEGADSIGDYFENLWERIKREFINSGVAAVLGFDSPGTPLISGIGQMLGGGGASGGKAGGGGIDLFSLAGLSRFMGATPLAGLGMGIQDLALNNTAFSGLFDVGTNIGSMSTMDIGLSAMAGYAGKWVGNAAAEALFGTEAESAYGATAGAVIGSIWGPLGSAIGGAIGGAIDVIAGGDGKTRSALGVSTNPNWTADPRYSATGASGLQYTAYQKRTGDEGAAIAEQMMQVFVATDSALTQFFDALGVTVDLGGQMLQGKASQFGAEADGFFGATGFNGLNESDLRGAADDFVREFVDLVNQSTKGNINLEPIFDLQLEGEMLGDTLLRVNAEFSTANGLLGALGFTLYDLSVEGMAAASGLVQALGGLESFSAGVSAYYQAFYTEEERLAALTEQLRGVFEGLNLVMPTTHQEFRALVDAAADAGASGQELFAQLIAIAPAFDQVARATGSAAGVITQAAQDILSAGQITTISDIAGTILGNYQDRQQTLASLNEQLGEVTARITELTTGVADTVDPIADVVDTVTGSVDRLRFSSSQMRSVADNLLATVARLTLSDISPLTNRERLDFAESQYRQAQAQARAGDPSQVAGALQAYLAEVSSYFASSDEGLAIWKEELAWAEQMGITLGGMAEQAERQEQAIQSAATTVAAAQGLTTDEIRRQADLDRLLQEKQLIEQQIQSLTATDSLALLDSQLAALIDANTGIESMAGLLAILPQGIADALAGIVGVAPEEYGSDTNLVERLFNEVLGRSATGTEAAYWQTYLDNSGIAQTVDAFFKRFTDGSYESAIKQGDILEAYSNDVFANINDVIMRMYTDVLGRSPALSGANFWQGVLDGGASIEHLVSEMFRSVAAQGVTPLMTQEQFLSSFDTGTSYVTHDQTANIHRGEIIVDPQSSDVLRRYGIPTTADCPQLLAAVRDLAEKVEALRYERHADSGASRDTQVRATREIVDAVGRAARPAVRVG